MIKLDNLNHNDLIKSGSYKPGIGAINPPRGIYEPDETQNNYFIDVNGVRGKYYHLTFDILRQMARKVAPITSIHSLRTMQIRPFSVRSYNEDETGYLVKLKDKKRIPTAKEKRVMEEIEEFVQYSGALNVPVYGEREGMEELNEMLTRDLLTIDQIAITPRYNRKGKLIDYYMLDGATIKHTIRGRGYNGDKEIRFVQEVEGKIVETFTAEEIIFYYANRRSDIRYRGYGYSFIEMSVDIITSWLFGMTYNREFFNSSSQPKGIVTFDGDRMDQNTIEELQRQWVSMFKGVKGLWKTPFLQYAAKWQSIAPSNRDMEFNEYIQVLSSWVFSIHGTDAAEVGQRLNQAQSVLSENQESKIAYSKSRGLRHILRSLSNIYNKILFLNPDWRDYQLVFTGFEAKDQQSEINIDEKQTSTYMTVNEKRKEKDLPEIEAGNIVLNPQYLQALQAEQAKEQEKEAAEQGDGADLGDGKGGNTGQNDTKEQDNDGEIEVSEDDIKLIDEELNKSQDDEYIEIII